MTLVLPVPSCGGGGVRALVSPSSNDLVNNSGPSLHANNRKKLAMPCGFDGEPLDFESALMLQGDFGSDWSSLKTPWSNNNCQSVTETTASPFPSPNIDGAKSSSTCRVPSITASIVNSDPTTAVSSESSSDSDVPSDSLMECTEQTNKRKTFVTGDLRDNRLTDCVDNPRKRCRTDSMGSDTRVPEDRDTTVTLADDLPLLTNTSPPLPLPSPPKDNDPVSPSSCTDEDDLFTPRRRVPMLWSPRLRLKDERRRVLKMSLSKLRKIEDPELFLRRSVLVNNTMKRLQREIRDERFAKYHQSTIQESHHHHRQLHHSHSYGMDVPMLSNVTDAMPCKEQQNNCSQSHYNASNLKQPCWGFDNQPPEDGFPNKKIAISSCGLARPAVSSATVTEEEGQQDSSGSSSDEGSSCDEMFGINEDFLRIHIPKSPPTPVSFEPDNQSCSQPSISSSTTHLTSKLEHNQLDCVRVGHVHLSSIERPLTPCEAPSDDESCGRMLSLDNLQENKNQSTDISRTNLESLNGNSRYLYDHHHHLTANHNQIQHHSGGQCSAQYRTQHHGQQLNHQDSFGHCASENSFSTPGMPILDSVVYHSLLASLDT